MSENITDLVEEGAQLNKKKRALLDEKGAIDKRIQDIQKQLLEIATKEQRDRFDSESNGSFVVKPLNRYSDMSKSNLQDLCIRFSAFLAPNDSNAQSAGIGMSDWLWGNRAYTTTNVIEWVEEHKEKPVKSEDEVGPSSKRRKRAPSTADDTAVPRTVEEFQKLGVFQNLSK